MSVFHFFHFLYSQLTFSKEKKREEFGCFSFIEMVLCRSNKSGSLSSHIYLSALYFFYLLLFFFLFLWEGTTSVHLQYSWSWQPSCFLVWSSIIQGTEESLKEIKTDKCPKKFPPFFFLPDLCRTKSRKVKKESSDSL